VPSRGRVEVYNRLPLGAHASGPPPSGCGWHPSFNRDPSL